MTCVQVNGEQSLQLQSLALGSPLGPTLKKSRFVTFSCTVLSSGSLLLPDPQAPLAGKSLPGRCGAQE